MPGARPSNQAWSLPSIWMSSPRQARRLRGWWIWAARCRRGFHRPAAVISDRTVSLAEDQAVALAQLLAGKRGAEVGVAIADDAERALGDSRCQLMVARATALGGDQACGALGLVPEDEPLELTPAKPEPLRGEPDRQHPVDHGLHRLDPIDLAHAHRDRRRRSCHRRTSAPGARAADSATSLLGQNATLLIGSYSLNARLCILCKLKSRPVPPCVQTRSAAEPQRLLWTRSRACKPPDRFGAF